MKNHRLNISGLIWVLVVVVTIMACNISLPGNSPEDANSLTIVISNPLGTITVSPGEEVAITSTSFSESGITQVELLVNGQVAATSGYHNPRAGMFVTLTNWVPTNPGNYQISVVVEDVDNQRVESEQLTVIVVDQAEEQSNAPTATTNPIATNPPPAPTNAPVPTSTQTPFVITEPSPTSEIIFNLAPIIVAPVISSGTPSIHFEMETVLVPPDIVTLVEVYCPEGSVVTGGGYFSSALYGLDILISKMEWPNGWHITAKNRSNINETVGVAAVCLSNSGGNTTMVENLVTVQGDEHRSISAACPAGSVVTGGGWSKYSESQVLRQSSQAGNNWSVRVENYSHSSTQARAYAICLSDTNATSYQFMESLDIGAGKGGSVFALCQPGQLVSGGGFFRGVALHTNVPIGPNAIAPKYGWGSYAHNGAHHTTFNIQSFTTCLSFP